MWNSSAKAAQGNAGQPTKIFVRTKWLTVGIVVGVLGSSLARTGLPKPEQPDVSAGSAARTVGAIDGTVRVVTQGVQEVSSSVRDQFDRPHAVSGAQPLKSRVETAMFDNESLNSKKIVVAADDEGVVTLKGEVATTSAKEQAVDLASGLRGVARVEDQLAVTPKRRVFEVSNAGSRRAVTTR